MSFNPGARGLGVGLDHDAKDAAGLDQTPPRSVRRQQPAHPFQRVQLVGGEAHPTKGLAWQAQLLRGSIEPAGMTIEGLRESGTLVQQARHKRIATARLQVGEIYERIDGLTQLQERVRLGGDADGKACRRRQCNSHSARSAAPRLERSDYSGSDSKRRTPQAAARVRGTQRRAHPRWS